MAKEYELYLKYPDVDSLVSLMALEQADMCSDEQLIQNAAANREIICNTYARFDGEHLIGVEQLEQLIILEHHEFSQVDVRVAYMYLFLTDENDVEVTLEQGETHVGFASNQLPREPFGDGQATTPVTPYTSKVFKFKIFGE